jgi:hypothetical protein
MKCSSPRITEAVSSDNFEMSAQCPKNVFATFVHETGMRRRRSLPNVFFTKQARATVCEIICPYLSISNLVTKKKLRARKSVMRERISFLITTGVRTLTK